MVINTEFKTVNIH